MPDNYTLLLELYLQAYHLETQLQFSLFDERGNTRAHLDTMRDCLLRLGAKEQAAYIAGLLRDSSVHSLDYEEAIVAKLELIVMEWPMDDMLQRSWATCPLKMARLSSVIEDIWPDVVQLAMDTGH